jgi:hypothetical protein
LCGWGIVPRCKGDGECCIWLLISKFSVPNTCVVLLPHHCSRRWYIFMVLLWPWILQGWPCCSILSFPYAIFGHYHLSHVAHYLVSVWCPSLCFYLCLPWSYEFNCDLSICKIECWMSNSDKSCHLTGTVTLSYLYLYSLSTW